MTHIVLTIGHVQMVLIQDRKTAKQLRKTVLRRELQALDVTKCLIKYLIAIIYKILFYLYSKLFKVRNFIFTWLIFLDSLFLYSCHENTKYRINGTTDNCEGCEVTLKYLDLKQHELNTIDSTHVKNNKFSLSGTIHNPDFYLLSVNNINIIDNVKKNINYMPTIYIDTFPIYIKYQFNGIDKNYAYPYPDVISKSSVQNELNRFMDIRDSLYRLFRIRKEALKRKLMGTMDDNDSLMYILADSLKHFDEKFPVYDKNLVERFVKNHPHSIVSPFELLNIINSHADFINLQKLYDGLDPKVANSQYGKLAKEKLLRYISRNKKFRGDTITFLRGKDPNGDSLNLRYILRQNKITLIDFWASWCGGCRLEMPRLKEIYSKFHTKGFDIVAVSLDESRQKWLMAIKEDNLQAHHISELKGGNGYDTKRFEVHVLPSNFVLDHGGRIIATNVSTDSLKKILTFKLREN